jgi:tetratricopeptide (TPR) repeat protein
MVAMRKKLVSVLIAGSIILSACAQFPTPGALIKPPGTGASTAAGRKAGNQNELLKIVQTFLPAGAHLLAPEPAGEVAQSTRELIQTGDLNHDGQPEIIAGYRTSQGSAGVLVLEEIKNGKWTKLWQEEGGYSLERLQLADITGDGRDELLIGWTIGASAGNGLDILAWQDGNLKKIAGTGYHRLEVEDLAGEKGKDGRQELAVWVKDTGDAMAVDVLRWDGKNLIPAEDVYTAYFPRVVEYYRKRVWEHPQSSFYWYYLADALVKVREYRQALEAAEKGMAADKVIYPSIYGFQLIKARALTGLERYHEAAAIYQDIIAAGEKKLPHPQKPASMGSAIRSLLTADLSPRMMGEACYEAGEIYTRLGQNQRAAEYFQKALLYLPGWDKPRQALEDLKLIKN